MTVHHTRVISCPDGPTSCLHGRLPCIHCTTANCTQEVGCLGSKQQVKNKLQLSIMCTSNHRSLSLALHNQCRPSCTWTTMPMLLVCRCMYGLLMLLPQSDAFKTLHARLHSVPTMALLQLDRCLAQTDPSQSQPAGSTTSARAAQFGGARPRRNSSSGTLNKGIDFKALTQLFKERQVCGCWTPVHPVNLLACPLVWDSHESHH